jgi:anti-sigma regulatory factor (Ser/Thr protein kinase)
MRINISKAIKQFFPNPSLDLVYFEAIANSLDSNASEIDLKITIESFENAGTLKIQVKDNGIGFTERGFERFCQLLETDSPDNKGLGRLVFLNYFGKAKFDSLSRDSKRTFVLDNEFE